MRGTYSMAKDLLIRALQGEQVAQIPWLPHIGTHAAQLLGVSAQCYLQDADLLARGALLCADRYRCDGIPLLDDPSIEAIALGCMPHWSEQGPPSLVSAPLSRLASEQLTGHLPSLPSDTTGRWPTIIAAGAQLKSELERRDVALVGLAAGPCTIAYQLRGMMLFSDLFRHPECAAQLFAYAGEVCAISARIYTEIIGCDIVAIHDTAATMLQPTYFQRYVLPNMQKALQVIHRVGKTSSFWACGESVRVIREMASSGVHSIAIDECMALSYVGDIAREHHIGFIGNFHVTAALFEETEEATVDVQRCINEGKRFPGYVFGLGGPLTQHINPLRLDEAVTAFLNQTRYAR